jgi:hypothetical protein
MRDMFTKHLRCVHARTHEFRSRAVFMRLHLYDQRAAQARRNSQQTRFPKGKAARSLVGSARLVSVPQPLDTP